MHAFIEDTKTYIPYFNGNRELPEDEQVVVTFKVPDIQLKRRLKPRPKLKFNYDTEGNTTGGETEVTSDRTAVVSGMLVSIRNLSYENKRGIHRIQKAIELFTGPTQYEPLVDELYEEFSKELDRAVDEKN